MQTVVEQAVRAYEETLFWEQFGAGYSRLADDPAAWEDITAECAIEERALRDGLE